jgi:hypothetical protein
MSESYLTVPVHLQNLFDMMDFIGKAKIGFKPCFNGMYYVSAKSWLGALYRLSGRESQGDKGNCIVRGCCQESSQAYEQYKDTEFEEIILSKMITLRGGIVSIIKTYSLDDQEIQTCTHLQNSILEIDRKIPRDIMVSMGIVPPNVRKTSKTAPISIDQPLKDRNYTNTPPIVRSGSIRSSLPLDIPNSLRSQCSTPRIHHLSKDNESSFKLNGQNLKSPVKPLSFYVDSEHKTSSDLSPSPTINVNNNNIKYEDASSQKAISTKNEDVLTGINSKPLTIQDCEDNKDLEACGVNETPKQAQSDGVEAPLTVTEENDSLVTTVKSSKKGKNKK